MFKFIAGAIVGAATVYCLAVNPKGAHKFADKASAAGTSAYNVAQSESK